MGRLKPCYGLGEGEGDIDACTLVFLLSIGRYEIRLEGGPNKETLVVVVGMTSVCSESRLRPRADFIVFTVFLSRFQDRRSEKILEKINIKIKRLVPFFSFFLVKRKSGAKGWPPLRDTVLGYYSVLTQPPAVVRLSVPLQY